jgi:hypothetical protein
MLRRILLALTLVVALPVVSSADSFTAYGPHLGFGQGFDQFVVGGQLQWHEIAPQLDFVPSLDLGLGGGATTFSINGDFHYRLATRSTWQPYLGGGVGIHFNSFDNSGPGRDASSTDAGGQFIVGADVAAKRGGRFFAEVKIGFGDSPDLRALAGLNFGSR